MKKYLISISLTLIAIFGSVNLAKADDGGPNSIYWIKSSKTTCFSVLDPEHIKSDSFLVFDYSPSIGQSLGKPWTIVEKGKCYEVDQDGGSIYRVKIIKGNERQQIANYNAYKPTDDIEQTFCRDMDSYNCFDSNQFLNVSQGFFGHQAVTLQRSDVLFDTGVRANEVFPTKYDFGDPITSYTSMPSRNPAVNDPSFVQAGEIYATLASDLQNKLQSCDSRTRVEYQASVEPTYNDNLAINNIIWHLGDNKQFSFAPPETFQAIDLMGCRQTFIKFLESHKTDFATIDSLTSKVAKKYPTSVGDQYDQPLKKRDQGLINKILSYKSSPETVATEIDTSSISTSTATASPNTIDEPTPEKKTNLLVRSTNPLVRAYVLLPVAALFGIIIFILLNKRQK